MHSGIGSRTEELLAADIQGYRLVQPVVVFI